MIRKLQTNFTAGEIVPAANPRSDLPMVQNGVALMRNCKILATGGARRRPGLALAAEIEARHYQHVEFIFNSEQTYQFLFSAGRLDVHDGVSGLPLQRLDGMTWTDAMIEFLSTHAWGDFMFVTHPDLKPQQIQRRSATTFTVEDYSYERSPPGAFEVFQPYYRFARPDVQLFVGSLDSGFSGVDGWHPGAMAHLQTLVDYFTPEHVGVMLQVGTGQIRIDSYANPRSVVGAVCSPSLRLRLTENALQVNAATTNVKVYDPFHSYFVGQGVNVANAVAFGMAGYDQLNGNKIVTSVGDDYWYYDYTPTPPVVNSSVVGGGPDMQTWSAAFSTVDWKEAMYSTARGWPHCVSGYLSRLIFGGGTSTPNRMSMSTVESPFNFDAGTGQDDESVQVGLTGVRTPIIRQIVGAQHLQIFTSEGEYYVPRLEGNANITPKNIAVLPQSHYGIKPGPQAKEFDGSTIYISKNAQNLRQMVFGGQDDAYSSPNLAFPSSHLLLEPRSLAVQMEDSKYAEATAYIVNADSSLAVFTMIRSEKIAAWGMWEGMPFSTACAVDNRMFFVVRKVVAGVDRTFLVKVDHDRLLDIGKWLAYVGRSGQDYVWGGLPLTYAGATVNVVVDSLSDIGGFVVDALGQVTIPVRANYVEAGFGFTPRLRTINPEMVLPAGPTPGEMRRIVRASIDFEHSLGMAMLSSANNKTKLLGTKAHDDLGLPARAIDGNLDVYMLGWADKVYVELQQTSNGPMTVLSINLDVEF